MHISLKRMCLGVSRLVLHFLLNRMAAAVFSKFVRNEEVSLRVNGQRNIVHEIRKRKANWIGHILRRNCLLKHVIER